ncbi:2-iminobutanoate/2-iminopropanoate deaminase-like [Lingula anatina]|uniref:2-iminobutanoate/2-iminopropanoate deaminase-like n=1 Tax=Lingula anatina TaxID=7574 RepID=A0A1S3H4Y9_LINAN|nr:2-iminobutanoate/2-iminopropanoate deaminase-like [Lingula anatina]|eukprot:XP_013380531.1 2-iminobutanoate/2-iminopropanoate deaminase-like [Lingula anatina]
MASYVARKVVSTAAAPKAIGPYSQAVIAENTMYMSGQVGMDPATGELVEGGVLKETEQAFKNINAVLEAAGCSFNNIVKTTVFLADIKEYAAVNEVYAKYFSGSFPARSAFQVAALPKGARIEIECIAKIGHMVDHQPKL